MSNFVDRPLVTFALFTYNHERFVLKALDAALEQDYTPLELLISDDCSSDRTYALIETRVQGYEGNHQIILNRNPTNLGIAAHVNRVMEIANGDIIVVAAGDDISVPSRASETVDYFISSSPRIYAASSSVILINTNGSEIGNRSLDGVTDIMLALQEGQRWVTGCSHAWDRKLFEVFGPLRKDVIAEDKVVGFRGMLLGGRIGYIENDLVRYRQHDQSISSSSFVYRRSYMYLESVLSHKADLETLVKSGQCPEAIDVERLSGQIECLVRSGKTYVRLVESGFWRGLIVWASQFKVVEAKVASVILGVKIAKWRRNSRLPQKIDEAERYDRK